MLKRIYSLLLCLVLTATFIASTAVGEYATKWNIGDLYEDDEAFKDDCAAVTELIDQIGGYRGRLGDAKSLRDYMELRNRVLEILRHVKAYEELLSGLNATDPSAARVSSAYGALAAKYSKALSFEDDEFGAMTTEERIRLAQSPEVSGFRYALRQLEDPDELWLDENSRNMIALFSQALGGYESVYNVLDYSELPYPVYFTPDGERIVLDDKGYSDLLDSDLTTEQRVTIERQYNKRYGQFKNTFALLLDGHMRGNWVLAQAEGFDSVREYYMAYGDIEPEIYDLIIEAGHKSTKALNRYNEIYRRYLGLEGDPYNFEVYRVLDERNAAGGEFSPKKSFDECVDDVKNALSIFGDEYVSVFDRIVTEGHVDAYPASGKNTGAFCLAVGDDTLPYVLLNYNADDSGDGASALAHEMGHALYDYFSFANQPVQYQEPAIFTHEVASTANELIFFDYMYNNAKSDAERVYYLRQQLNMFNITYFYQMLIAEMEDYCYSIIESGDALTPECLNEKYKELQAIYNSIYREVEGYEENWAGFAHMFYNYYVYQYVTSLTYSSAIASKIIAGDENALNSFLEFLKLGSSALPSDLLKTVGIDPLDRDTYDAPINFYLGLLDKYEALLDDMGL